MQRIKSESGSDLALEHDNGRAASTYRHLALSACTGMAMLAAPALADVPSGDTLKILDQYMITQSVAAKCGHADAALTDAFQNNFRLMTQRAQLALKAIASDLSPAHIDKVINDHYSEIDRRVIAIIAQESCDGPHAREALQKYDSVSRLGNTRILAEKSD